MLIFPNIYDIIVYAKYTQALAYVCVHSGKRRSERKATAFTEQFFDPNDVVFNTTYSRALRIGLERGEPK